MHPIARCVHQRQRPLIDTRELWREEKSLPDYDSSKPITRPLDPERADTIMHTEKDTLHCVCPATKEQRDLAFQGFEADRNTLKYRCPTAAYGLDCQGQAQCHQAGGVTPGDYGRIVRIKLDEHDRRIFVPTPHGSPSWRRGYNRRSALERINLALDRHFGFEQHFIRGIANHTAVPKGTLPFRLRLAYRFAHEIRPRPRLATRHFHNPF